MDKKFQDEITLGEFLLNLMIDIARNSLSSIKVDIQANDPMVFGIFGIEKEGVYQFTRSTLESALQRFLKEQNRAEDLYPIIKESGQDFYGLGPRTRFHKTLVLRTLTLVALSTTVADQVAFALDMRTHLKQMAVESTQEMIKLLHELERENPNQKYENIATYRRMADVLRSILLSMGLIPIEVNKLIPLMPNGTISLSFQNQLIVEIDGVPYEIDDRDNSFYTKNSQTPLPVGQTLILTRNINIKLIRGTDSNEIIFSNKGASDINFKLIFSGVRLTAIEKILPKKFGLSTVILPKGARTAIRGARTASIDELLRSETFQEAGKISQPKDGLTWKLYVELDRNGRKVIRYVQNLPTTINPDSVWVSLIKRSDRGNKILGGLVPGSAYFPEDFADAIRRFNQEAEAKIIESIEEIDDQGNRILQMIRQLKDNRSNYPEELGILFNFIRGYRVKGIFPRPQGDSEKYTGSVFRSTHPNQQELIAIIFNEKETKFTTHALVRLIVDELFKDGQRSIAFTVNEVFGNEDFKKFVEEQLFQRLGDKTEKGLGARTAGYAEMTSNFSSFVKGVSQAFGTRFANASEPATLSISLENHLAFVQFKKGESIFFAGISSDLPKGARFSQVPDQVIITSSKRLSHGIIDWNKVGVDFSENHIPAKSVIMGAEFLSKLDGDASRMASKAPVLLSKPLPIEGKLNIFQYFSDPSLTEEQFRAIFDEMIAELRLAEHESSSSPDSRIVLQNIGLLSESRQSYVRQKIDPKLFFTEESAKKDGIIRASVVFETDNQPHPNDGAFHFFVGKAQTGKRTHWLKARTVSEVTAGLLHDETDPETGLIYLNALNQPKIRAAIEKERAFFEAVFGAFETDSLTQAIFGLKYDSSYLLVRPVLGDFLDTLRAATSALVAA